MCYTSRRMEGFVRFREVLTPTAIYVLRWRGEIVYIGKSRNVYGRLAKHRQNLARKRAGLRPYLNDGKVFEFDDVWVKWVAIDELDREEQRLISKYRPKANVRLNHPTYDLSRIPAFKELLAKSRARSVPNYIRRVA